MKKCRLNSLVIVAILGLSFLLVACGQEEPGTIPTPANETLTPEGWIQSTEEPPGTPTPDVAVEAVSTATNAVGLDQISSLEDIAAILEQRAPVSTPTPGVVNQVIETILHEMGLSGYSFLGQTTNNWINIGLSILLVPIGYALGAWLLLRLLNWVVQRTKTHFDDEFLATIERELRWFVLLIVLQIAILRLEIWSIKLRIVLNDIFFFLLLGVLLLISLHLINFSARWYRANQASELHRNQMDPFIELLKRLGYVLVSMLALGAVLDHFGAQITLLTVIFLFGILIIVIGARAAVADAISGFIILVSQPFRVSDTILIMELNTRGDVQEIGLRTTRIRTRDGRHITIPNSLIGSSHIVNYTFPDTGFRTQIEFETKGAGIDRLHQLIEKAVRGVEGVLSDRPVDVLFLAFGGSSRQVRVRWWVDHVNNQNRIIDRVNRTLELALEEAGIDTPNPIYDLNLRSVGQKGNDTAQSFSNGMGEESSLEG